jgi:hypothetical protein
MNFNLPSSLLLLSLSIRCFTWVWERTSLYVCNTIDFSVCFITQNTSSEVSSRPASQKSPYYLFNAKFHTLFTRTCCWSLSWRRWIQSTLSDSTSLRSVLILSYNQRLSFPNGISPAEFLINILYELPIYLCVLHTPSLSLSMTWSPT